MTLPLVCYYSSKSGNTEYFSKQLDTKSIKIEKGLKIFEPFVIILPTYARADGTGAVHKTAIDFIKDHASLMLGVIGAGNINFGKFYAYAADVVSRRCNVPVLHKFELRGTTKDQNIINEKLRKLII